jgi:hypothetical protein
MNYGMSGIIALAVFGGLIWWGTRSAPLALSITIGSAFLIDIGLELRKIHETLKVIAKHMDKG